MREYLIVFASCFVLASCAPVPVVQTIISTPVPSPSPSFPAPPVRNSDAETVELTAEAVAVYDVKSHQFIYTKNPDKRLMPASTTKMMTMLVSLETYAPDEIVTIGRAADAVGHAVDIKARDQFRVIDVIKAMMINSGNDTAISLADHYPDGYAGFVEAMNIKARALGMKNTHFSNVSGVEADDHYSSARDLTLLAEEIMRQDTIRSIVSTKTASISTIDGKHRYQLENLNELLWNIPGVIGIKTGWTPVAGDCLVTYVDRNQDVITVVLNSKDRFADSAKLIEWVYNSFTWNQN